MTVQQYYTSQEFELPSVVFDVATERAESVELRFVVTDIEAKRVGFHPRFRSDAWAINDDRLVFKARVGPDETVTTLCALDSFDERFAALKRLDERVSELETHAETVEEHENRIERLGQRVTALGDELDTATTQLESLRTELERIESSAETAREEASDAGAHAGELDERLADLEEQLGGFERQLDSVAGDWESVEADVAALQEWRSNLASTFESFGE